MQNKTPAVHKFGLRSEVRKLLAAAGAKGISRHYIESATGATSAEAKKAISSLVQIGEAFSCRDIDHVWMYFSDATARDACVARAAVRATARVSVPSSSERAPSSYTAGPSKIAPRISGEPIITSSTRVTIAPTPLPRFYVPADHRGAFSLAGVGRDVQTGRGWA